MKRITAFLLVMAMLFCAAVFASADGGTQLTAEFTREGRIVKDLSGQKMNGAVSDRVLEKIYTLAENGKIDTAGVESSVFEVTMDEAGEVTLGQQTLTAENGCVYVSSNAEAIIFQRPNGFYPCGAGESTLTVYNSAGEEISTSQAKVTAMTSGKNLIINPCPVCGDNQSDRLHAQCCGHFSCEVGEVDHDAASCGYAGHFKCDGKEHSICPNCLEPLCEGEHGAGVCKHIHTVKRSKLLHSPNYEDLFQAVYCPVCGVYYIEQIEQAK